MVFFVRAIVRSAVARLVTLRVFLWLDEGKRLKHRQKIWAALLVGLCLATPQAGAADSAAAAPQQVEITDIEVRGNTLLPPDEIERTVALFKGRRTAEQLQDAAAAVQALYVQAGFGGVVAFLPPQPLGGGRLLITVLEGRVAKVVVAGNRRFDTDNVRRSVPVIQEGQTPRVRAIDTEVQLANENQARTLAVTLEEGAERGEVDVRILVTEDPVVRYTVSADNTGNSRTGRTRVSFGYHNAALTDRDDQLSLRLQVSPERLSAVRVVTAGYRLPVYPAGLMLAAYASYSNVDATTTSTAVGNVNFSGRGRVLGAQAMRFLQRAGEFEQRVFVSLDKRDYLNNCAIFGLPAGACGSAGESVTVHPLTLGYENLRKGGRPAGMSLSLSHNLALGGTRGGDADFEAVRPGAPKGFQVFRGSGFLSLPVGENWQLNFRALGQATRDRLVPGEQFGLAGVGVVRGYEEREVAGDSGLAGGIEVMMPRLLPRFFGDPASGFGDLRLLAFADAGNVSSRDGLTCDGVRTTCTLSSLGVGVRFLLGTSRWRVDLARAGNTGRFTDRGDFRVHFDAAIAFP